MDEVLRHDQHRRRQRPVGRGASTRWLVAERQWWDELGRRDLPYVLRTRQRRRGGTPITPKTVVFFTDGVPTWDRITKRGAPGVLTTMPAVVGSAQGWFDSTGSAYSQVAFNRADYWADKWRAVEDTKLIGVGVGEDINLTSSWMQSPAPAIARAGRSDRTSTTSRRSSTSRTGRTSSSCTSTSRT